jgi:uncharacterized OB-fold protein
VTDYRKPLPDVDDAATSEFWRGTRDSTLLVQQCSDCGYRRWPPGPICPECLAPDFGWVTVPPHGTLVTYCVYHKAFSAAFADDVPYAVAYVQLDGGLRMYGTLVGDLDGIECGDPLDAVFTPATPEVTLVQWTASKA